MPEREEILALPLYEEYSIHYMCLIGWMYRYIDDYPEMVERQADRIARKTRLMGAKYLRSFLMNGSRHPTEQYIQDALPWEMVKVDGVLKVDFSTKNLKWWRCAGILERACRNWKVFHRPTLNMARYNDDIYDRRFNVQGIHGFWRPAALKVQSQFAVDYLLFQKSFRVHNWKPTVEFCNEPMHGGNWEFGAIIADWHLALFRAIQHLTTIDRCWTTSSGSEFAHANFVGPEWNATLGRWFGFKEFIRRLVKPDYHCVTDLQTLLASGFLFGLGSAWRHFCINEDGADSGSYHPIPWTPYSLANKQESKDMLEYAITMAKKYRKKLYYTSFVMDCLRQDVNDLYNGKPIAKEEFDDFAQIKWGRLKAYMEVRQELGY